MLGTAAVTVYLIPCGESRGITSVAYYFTANTVVSMLVKPLVARLERRHGMRKPIAFGACCCAVGMVILAFAYGMTSVFIAAVLLGLGSALCTQILHAKVLSGADADRRGRANALYMLFGDVGNGMGSAAWGATSTVGGYRLMFLLSACAALPTVFLPIHTKKCDADKMVL